MKGLSVLSNGRHPKQEKVFGRRISSQGSGFVFLASLDVHVKQFMLKLSQGYISSNIVALKDKSG